MEFEYFNPNPRGKWTTDCVKRAIVAVTGIDYLELEKDMNRKKVVKDALYKDNRNWKPYIMNYMGFKKVNTSVPKGTKRWTVHSIERIMKNYPNINYILHVSKHLIGIRNNTIYDLVDDRKYNKCIYELFLYSANDEEVNKIQEEISKGDRMFIL